MSIPQTDPQNDQPGTWVNITGDLAEFVPVGEQCSANVRAEQQDAIAAAANAGMQEVPRGAGGKTE